MNYKPPFFLFNHHLETIFPSVARQVDFRYNENYAITTPDDDELELGVYRHGATHAVIISHGLEGNNQRAYVRGMARALAPHGYDIFAWNYRGCGSQMNRRLRFYHSGATDDLDVVANHVAHLNSYQSITLIGFSLGGNITLKYLGENRIRPTIINRGIAISVPMDLALSCEKISTPANTIYHNRFLKSLKGKIIAKSKIMTGLDVAGIDNIRTLKDFDDRYTAPLHGFADADHYYRACSSLYFVNAITTPTLIINAENDPFLSKTCYPVDALKSHPAVTLETPGHGGHVGFSRLGHNGIYWSEHRSISFLTNKG